MTRHVLTVHLLCPRGCRQCLYRLKTVSKQTARYATTAHTNTSASRRAGNGPRKKKKIHGQGVSVGEEQEQMTSPYLKARRRHQTRIYRWARCSVEESNDLNDRERTYRPKDSISSPPHSRSLAVVDTKRREEIIARRGTREVGGREVEENWQNSSGSYSGLRFRKCSLLFSFSCSFFSCDPYLVC